MSGFGRFPGSVLATEYRNARQRMQEIAGVLGDDDIELVVEACPAWRVKDLFSHVTGIAVDLGSGNSPAGDTQAWVDRQVEERYDTPLAAIVGEWSQAADRFESMIEAAPAQLWGLTYDTVVHEHDLRAAVGRPGARDSDGVKVAAELGLNLVKGDLARAGLPAVLIVIDGREYLVGTGEPELSWSGSAFDCLRLLGSRRTADEMRRAGFIGDLDSFLAGLLHMELPVRSLGE
ncbi:MAG: maleylpyruvate isomerase family mycothiol-dependent enzyme [Ilumatobacteraceae bacterium]